MNPLGRKLSHIVDLSEEDHRLLDGLCANVRPFKAKRDLIKEGDRPDAVFLLIEGWAMRYKILPNGNRQVMAYLVPGDLCDIHVFILKEMDHSIGLLSDAQVAVIPRDHMLELLDRSATLTRALWWATMVDEGILREWLVNLGQRDAHDRISHLFVELWLRLRAVGATQGQSFELPLTQTDLGDTLGLTPVHINRMLQRMRGDGLVELSHGRLHIPDVDRLMAVTRFQSNYLHLERRHELAG